MKKAVLFFFLFLLISCGERVLKVDQDGKQWLAQFSAKPEIQISGNWQSLDWGTLTLTQEANSSEVVGIGDSWNIQGVVSGNSLYLIFSDKGQIYYSAILKISGEQTLEGYYAKYALINEENTETQRQPMKLLGGKVQPIQ